MIDISIAALRARGLKPECGFCGRRHGDNPLIAALSPLEFGKPPYFWAWLDESPPPHVRETAKRMNTLLLGPVWRSQGGIIGRIPEAHFPRAREAVELWHYTPTANWEGWEEFYCCDRCEHYTEELDDYRRERVVLPYEVPREQLVFPAMALTGGTP